MERDVEKQFADFDLEISTHTLTWSVTAFALLVGNRCGYFNSHAHVERDVDGLTALYTKIEFQLTRSRGA